MFTFRAFYRDGRQGPDRPFVLHDYYLLLASFCCFGHLVVFADFPDIPAFAAFQLTCRRDHQTLALGTEHRLAMVVQTRLKLG